SALPRRGVTVAAAGLRFEAGLRVGWTVGRDSSATVDALAGEKGKSGSGARSAVGTSSTLAGSATGRATVYGSSVASSLTVWRLWVRASGWSRNQPSSSTATVAGKQNRADKASFRAVVSLRLHMVSSPIR